MGCIVLQPCGRPHKQIKEFVEAKFFIILSSFKMFLMFQQSVPVFLYQNKYVTTQVAEIKFLKIHKNTSSSIRQEIKALQKKN